MPAICVAEVRDSPYWLDLTESDDAGRVSFVVGGSTAHASRMSVQDGVDPFPGDSAGLANDVVGHSELDGRCSQDLKLSQSAFGIASGTHELLAEPGEVADDVVTSGEHQAQHRTIVRSLSRLRQHRGNTVPFGQAR